MFNFGDDVDRDTVDKVERAGDSRLSTNRDKSATKSKLDFVANLSPFVHCRLCRQCVPCEQLARVGVEPATSQPRVRRLTVTPQRPTRRNLLASYAGVSLTSPYSKD